MHQDLSDEIKAKGLALGFQAVGITDVNLGEHKDYFQSWLNKGYAGNMSYMSRHTEKRTHPDQLIPGTLRVISVRLDYLPEGTNPIDLLDHPQKAYIARYALGRDYHKLMRKRLQTLATWINEQIESHQYRVFVDSAPVLEKALAQKSGLGWIGKHTLVINQNSGSLFFLGEIYTNLPLAIDPPQSNHCGSCSTCMDICPTQAIVAPYELDARKCIAYLTIEHKGAIDIEFREKMGNRIFGCDDCQLFCPWNKFATPTQESAFAPRHQLDDLDLIDLFQWDEDTFLNRTLGSAIRRTGFIGWTRNLSIALGNAKPSPEILTALHQKLNDKHVQASPMLMEHIQWAIEQQKSKTSAQTKKSKTHA